MNLQEAVSSVLSQYAGFTGRARRSEFWFWFLAVVLACLVATAVDAIIGAQIVLFVVAAASIVPGLAVGARRLHDTGRSGWWQLLALVPFVGAIVLIVWWAAESQPDNEHGPRPDGGVHPPATPAA